jgi:hypothetical protein
MLWRALEQYQDAMEHKINGLVLGVTDWPRRPSRPATVLFEPRRKCCLRSNSTSRKLEVQGNEKDSPHLEAKYY